MCCDCQKDTTDTKFEKKSTFEMCQKTVNLWDVPKIRQILNFSPDHRKSDNLWNVLRLPETTTWALRNLDFLSAKNNSSKNILGGGRRSQNSENSDY